MSSVYIFLHIHSLSILSPFEYTFIHFPLSFTSSFLTIPNLYSTFSSISLTASSFSINFSLFFSNYSSFQRSSFIFFLILCDFAHFMRFSSPYLYHDIINLFLLLFPLSFTMPIIPISPPSSSLPYYLPSSLPAIIINTYLAIYLHHPFLFSLLYASP